MEAPAEELLKKLQELEVGKAMLKQEMSKLMPKGGAGERRWSHSVLPQWTSRTASTMAWWQVNGCNHDAPAWGRGSSFGHSSRLQSMGQSVHIFDLD